MLRWKMLYLLILVCRKIHLFAGLTYFSSHANCMTSEMSPEHILFHEIRSKLYLASKALLGRLYPSRLERWEVKFPSVIKQNAWFVALRVVESKREPHLRQLSLDCAALVLSKTRFSFSLDYNIKFFKRNVKFKLNTGRYLAYRIQQIRALHK